MGRHPRETNNVPMSEETNNKTLTKKEKQPGLLENIRLVTHNVQGLNEALKYKNWMERCYEENVHIIAMSETKITESSNHKFFLANPYYEVYTANSNEESANKQESSMGAAIAVVKTLQPYINNIVKIAGTAIAVNLFFLGNQQIRVISIYL